MLKRRLKNITLVALYDQCSNQLLNPALQVASHCVISQLSRSSEKKSSVLLYFMPAKPKQCCKQASIRARHSKIFVQALVTKVTHLLHVVQNYWNLLLQFGRIFIYEDMIPE